MYKNTYNIEIRKNKRNKNSQGTKNKSHNIHNLVQQRRDIVV
jgi:hypothetical protein